VSTGDTAALGGRRELQRKAIHAATAVIPVAYAAGVSRPVVLAACLGLTAMAVAVEVGRRVSPEIAATFRRWTGPLLRAHERAGGLAGATWLFATFALVTALTAPGVAVAAMWAVAAGDGAAGVVGRLAGRLRLANGKSLEGTLAILAMTAAGAYGLGHWPVGPSLLLGTVAALAELPRGPGDDNLRVGGAVGVTGSLLIAITH
jgi:dolichol kinase